MQTALGDLAFDAATRKAQVGRELTQGPASHDIDRHHTGVAIAGHRRRPHILCKAGSGSVEVGPYAPIVTVDVDVVGSASGSQLTHRT